MLRLYTLLACLGFATFAPAQSFTLDSNESYQTSGCSGTQGCPLCPIQLAFGLSGSFDLTFVQLDGTFEVYSLQGLQLQLPGSPGITTGSGTYRYDPTALLQEITLNVDFVDANGVVTGSDTLVSGVIAESGAFPNHLDIGASTLIPCSAFGFLITSAAAEEFLRGDCNNDGTESLADPIFNLVGLFTSGPAPGCMDACDVNDDGSVTIADAIFQLGHLFLPGSTPPPPPLQQCGVDPTSDTLDCANFVAC
ncbi:MAG: hypothetical protein AAF581_07615 [Planctomycetota bacterium]